MRIETAGRSHVGMKRAHNEDTLLLFPEESLFCVADGMGGHSCGEIAAKIAVEQLAGFYRLTSQDEDATWPFKMDKARNYEENRLTTAIKLANIRIYERASSDQKLKGMGTTIATIRFAPDTAYIAHVGDSRVYCLRDRKILQLTEDHSLLNDYLKAKRISAADVENFPHKNVIVRALGMKETVQVDIAAFRPKDRDLFLLCSDGLSGMLQVTQIQDTLLKARDLAPACDELVEMANHAGGHDNITCVLARYHRN
jgi:PPM family protein phosphatase